MELRLLLDVLWRRRYIVILVFAAVLGAAVLAVKSMPKMYSSTLKIISEKPFAEDYIINSLGLPSISSAPSLSIASSVEDGTGVDDLLELATTTPILEKVIDRLQLRDSRKRLLKADKFLGGVFLASDFKGEAYVEVENTDGSNIMDIDARSRDRDEAAMIANDVAAAICEASIEERREDFTKVRKFIEAQIDTVHADYQGSLKAAEIFAVSNSVVDLDLDTSNAINKLMDLIRAKENLLVTLARDRAEEQVIREQLAQEKPEAISAGAMESSSRVADLNKQLSDANIALSAMREAKTEQHPDVDAQRKLVGALTAELEHEISILKDTNRDLQGIERSKATTLASMDTLDEQIKESTASLYAIPTKKTDYVEMALQLASIQSLYVTLSARLYEVELAETMSISCMRVISPAVPADIGSPKTPSKVVALVLGIFLGTFFSVGLAIVLEYMDDSVKTLANVQDLETPVFGVIPNTELSSGFLLATTSRVEQRLAHPFAMTAERLLTLTPDHRVILMTSANLNSGTSLTAANLAVTLARKGRSVALVDLNITKPSAHRRFGFNRAPGLADVVRGSATIESALHKTSCAGLNVLTAGEGAEPLESSRVRQVIQDLAAAHDTVIVDAEPVLLNSHTMAAIRDAHAVVITARRGRTSIDDIRRAIAMIRDAEPKTVVGLMPVGFSPSSSNRLVRLLCNT